MIARRKWQDCLERRTGVEAGAARRRVGGLVRPWLLAALCLSISPFSGSLISAREALPRSWTLVNRALEMTITLDGRGRLGMTHLIDHRTGYDWCGEGAPSPVLQVAFQHAGEPFALTELSAFHLLSQRLIRSRDGTETLRLRVRAREYPAEMELHWRLRPGFSPVEKWYTLTNRGHEPITVSRLDTFDQRLEAPEALTVYDVHKGTAFPGTLRVNESPLVGDELQTIRCSASEKGDLTDSVPWFLLDRGRRRGGMLYAWAFSDTGRFQITPGGNHLEVTGGLASDRFKDRLDPGRTLLAPLGLFGPYAGTPDDAANRWHGFIHRYWAAAAADPFSPRVDYNTWWSLGLAVDEASCLRQLRVAADLGAEVFHLDAGWYRAPGDWHPDPT